MRQLGVEMIAAYSPEARGRSERAFATHQGRLPRALAMAGIRDRVSANRYLEEVYHPRFNARFAVPTLHGPRKLASHTPEGKLDTGLQQAA
ncbi:MAG: hypothetical protein LBD06_09605 [Candidatus Accumulibacter sp.]|jgi:hypothetical protein|nr:hypothetical protein [Accumulibacter sp.]